MTNQEILKHIGYTFLKAYATWEDNSGCVMMQ